MPETERMFISATKYAENGLPILIDWERVTSFELVEDFDHEEGLRLYTLVALDTGREYKVKETPLEIVNGLSKVANVVMSGDQASE